MTRPNGIASWRLDEVPCPLCGARRFEKLGIRGSREYNGADPHAEPHIVTNVVRCNTCDFIYTNPMIRGMEHLEQTHYADASRYQTTAGESSVADMFRKRLALISRYKTPGVLFDIGCGKGEFLVEARAQGWSGYGFEPSPGLSLHARQEHRLEVFQGRLTHEANPFMRKADAVTLNHVLEHVEQPVALLKAIKQHLHSDGILFIEVPNSDSHLLRTADAYFRLKGLNWSTRLSPLHPPFHRFGFTSRSLHYALSASGFEVVLLTTFGGQDRGCGGQRTTFTSSLLELASSALSMFGNRELLGVIARPAR